AWPGFAVPKARLAEFTARLAREGINMVRLHGLDSFHAEESILGRDGLLDPARLDILDFYIGEAKKQGIYLDLNLLTKRKYLADQDVAAFDTLPEGGKAAAMFNRHLIEMQKDYARQLFTHLNPYTGLKYADEPAIAVVEVVNENSLIDGGLQASMPEPYRAELLEKFAAWCAAKHVAQPQGSILKLFTKKDPDVYRFLVETQDAYFAEMYRFLKDDLKVKVPICASNTASAEGDPAGILRTDASLDFLDRHVYWDHPSGGWAPTSTFRNVSALASISDPRNPYLYLARARIAGKPMTVTEWNFVWANEYITEGPLTMAAFGGFQDCSALLQFNADGRPWSEAMRGCFADDNKPHFIAAAMAAGIAYLRGDVEPGPLKVLPLPADPTAVAGSSFPPSDLTRYRLEQTVGADAPPAPAASVSEKPSLRWLDSGALVVDTARTQAVSGVPGANAVRTGDAAFVLKNRFGQVILSSLDDKPIAQSRQLLLTATARAENTGEAYRLFRRGLTSVGTGPILLEPVEAVVSLDRGDRDGTPTVHALDWYGRRLEATVPVEKTVDGWNIRLGSVPGYWFEVSFNK
ncbi:MAG TPA: hypothetical protein VIM58_10685, partial [Candidatus Methylacidiphilales bacterium]